MCVLCRMNGRYMGGIARKRLHTSGRYTFPPLVGGCGVEDMQKNDFAPKLRTAHIASSALLQNNERNTQAQPWHTAEKHFHKRNPKARFDQMAENIETNSESNRFGDSGRNASPWERGTLFSATSARNGFHRFAKCTILQGGQPA